MPRSGCGEGREKGEEKTLQNSIQQKQKKEEEEEAEKEEEE